MTSSPNSPSTEIESALLFDNVTFRYRAQVEPTLFDINLRINSGEKILILGPSGSGKSSLIHTINGIIPHSYKGEKSGEILLMGKNISNLNIFDISKIAGTVLQDTDGQFVGLSAAEDIAFALENDCVPTEEMHSRIACAASLVNMAAHLSKSPHDLSGGQKQRISIAGILVDDVDMLLFDEPLANLDPASGKDIIELIDDLHKKTGKTIIIVEHRLEDVLHRPVDRIIVVDKGRIIADKNPAELLSSQLLKDIGIREPLYLSALAYSGITITPDIKPENVNTLHVDYKALLEWDNKQQTESSAQAAEPSCEEAALEVRDVSFRYSGQETDALHNVSFSVAPGECVALIGRNGSGKSTMAKCICGFVKPTSGCIRFQGQDLADLSIMERARKIGHVMQNPNQMLSFPMIYDEIAYGLRMRGASEKEVKESVHEVLEVSGLLPFRNWPVSALSYGQKKRLTIAVVLALRPSFMILDEPTAGQDYRHYTEFMEFLMALKEQLNVSLLLITHDMHLMLEYTSRAVVLSEGMCVADAEPFQVLTDNEIIEKASLKRTSLYDLALNAGLTDPRGFVGRYIAFDRRTKR